MAFDLDGARKAGYSDDEIADFMSKELGFDAPAARDAGYSSKAIVGHLAETLKTRERAQVNAELDVPYRPVSRAVAPKQNAGGGRGMMAEQAGDRAAYEAKKPTPAKPPAIVLKNKGEALGYLDDMAAAGADERAIRGAAGKMGVDPKEFFDWFAAKEGQPAPAPAAYPEPGAVRAAIKPSATTGEITPINAQTRGFGDMLDASADLAKTGAASAISGVASMPRGMVDAFRGMVRDSASRGLLQRSAIGNLAAQAMGLNPTAAESRTIDRTMAGLEGPVGSVIDKGTLALNDAGKTASDRLRATRTIQGQANEAGFTPTGNLVEAVRNWDFSKLSVGDDKSVEGAAFQIVGVMGSLAPILLARVFPGGAAGTGFAMAAGEGSNTARTYIKKLSDDQLASGSPYFKALIEQGEAPADARKMVTAKAEEQAAILQGIVGGASGKFIESALTGKVQQIIQGFGSRSARMGGGAAIVGAQGGVEEFSEGLGAEYGVNRAGVRKGYGEDSFANLVLGAIGEGPLGAAAGFNKGGPPEAPPADPYAPQSLFSTPPAAPPGGSSTPPAPDRRSGNVAGPSTQPAPQVIQSPEAAAAGLAPIVIPGTPDQNGAVGALTSSAPMLAAIDKATTEVGPVQPGDTSTEREQIPAANVQVAPPQAPAGDPPAPTVTALPDSFPSKSAASIFIKQNGLQDTVAEKGDAGWMVRPAMRAETPEEAAKNDARAQSLNTTFERIGSTERVRAVRGDASEKSTVARVLGEVFGLPQVLVRGIKDNALYLDGVSYINAKISKTGQVIQAAVHEAFHWAAATHPDIAQGYLDAITPFRRAGVLAERAKFENENLKPGERQFPLSAGRGEDFSKVNSAEEEVGADVWGAMGLDPVLWQQMRAKDPGLFRAIRYRFLENVTRAINALSKRGVNVGKLVTDLDRVRELTSDAMAAVARRGDAKKPYLETFPDSTAKPTDIGKPISATAIPNSAPAAPPSATPAPAPKVKPKKRAKDAFLAFLGDHGVSMAHQKTITGETGKKGNRMIQFAGPMFRHTGLALDELALLAVEAGFLTQADIDSDLDNGGVNKLIEMIRRAHAGEAIDTVSGQEDSFEALAQAHYEAMADAEAAIVEETSDDEINALLQLAGEEDASNEEIDYIPDQGNLAGQTEGAAPGAAVNRDSGGSQAARAAAGDEEGFDLTAPTPEGLKRTSEQGQARQQEQARRDAAPPPEEFVLTGSNRPADRAAAAGQMELGAAPADVVEQTPEGPVLMLQGDEAGLADALANVVENDDERLAALFNPPGKPAKPIVGATLPMDEAQARVDAWRAEAQRQGATGENAGRTVLSLFDTSGGWSQPWVDAGYNVIRFDIQDGRDINDFSAESLLEEFGNDDIWAVLAAPPCTDFASSGAQWWKAKDADGRTEASNELVRQTLRTVELFRPAVWSMENPVGRIARLNDLPAARLTFQPNLYGDSYTKKTLLWGNFNTDLPQAPVEDTEGSKMHKMSSGNKYGRSLTPEGFAYAFFVANNAAGMPPVERLAQEFHGIKANEFAPALERMSEADVRSLIQDRYYDGNLDAVRNLLASGQPRRSKKGEERVAQSKKVADPAFQARISRIARLTPEQQASTILAFMTGKAGRDAFIEQDIGQIPDVVQWLSERRAESGLPTLDISVDADREQLATMMAAEALAAIESAGNAVEWYDATIRKMLELMAVKYPELKSDPHARTAFLIAIAITSQTMNVEANLKFAASQYENRDANGMFPIRGSGKSLGAMEENFRLANTLLRVLGPDLLARFLVTEFTASELGAMGLPIDELGSESVLGSAVFGPKIGFGFFSNLTGNFEPTTMDMWFMRTVGRLAGTLASFEPGKFAGQVRRLRDALKERGSDGIYAPIFPASARQAARASDEGAVALARLVMSAHNRDYARNRAQFDSGARIKTNLVGASATIIKSMDKPKDAPQNGTERRLLRDVVKRMVTKVQSGHGKRIPPAALQALIWYPEQEFWKSLGVKLTVTSQDYAGAAVKFLEDAGYAPQTIAAAGRGSGSGGARQVAAGAGAGGNGQAGPVSLRADALEGRDRADFIRARLTGNPGLVDKVRRTLDEQHPEEVGPRRSKRGKDQLSFDYELDPSQTGPAGEAAKRRAVDAVDDLRGTAGILALALSRDLAARQRTTLVGQTVASPVDLAVLAQVYRDPRFETFRIFFVDGQDRVVSQIGLTQRLPGAVNAVMGDDAYEFANNLMVEARKKGATGFYMLHNHPSGQATPSGADESMTVSYAQQLMPTMKFHGHVVIDTNEFSVIDRNGRSQKHIRDFKQKAPLDRGDWEYWQIKGPNDAMNIAKAIEKDPNAVTLIMTNYQLQVHAVTTIPRASISSNKQATFKAVARATLRNTGSHVFAVSHDMDALLQVRGLVQDGIHISPNGRVSSLRETRPYGGNTPHHKASLRAPRLSPDTSEEFNYLRPVIKSAAPTSRNVPKGATGTLFELPRFSKTGSKAPLERDELGRFRFAYGRRLEDTVKALLDPILTRLALKMASPELRKKLRAMKAEIARAQETAVEVAESMKAMPTDQAEMISDIIEQELVAGTVPPAELVTIATRIGVAMEAQTNELVRLGMISQEAADRWRGRYLPRFYESKLSKRIDPWMQAVMMAIRRPKSMQGIRGNNLKARGLPLETIDVADLSSWLADGWEIRDENYVAGTSDRVTVWRDYTREEREEMGEIRDARFRFVMGYMAAQKDIALGRLFEKIAADTADTGPHPGWVKVPSTKVEETGVNRFGKLSGMWVPKEVFDHLAKYDDTGANHELLLMYRKALGLWKESKTVLNPTAHANNVFGNVTMAHFAGVSYWDVRKYAGTVRDLVKDAPMVREARDAGLFLSTMGKDEIVQALPESLRLLADMQESSLEKGGRRVWNALALWLRKPMGAAYAGEDLFFRYMIYREARGRGLEPEDAVNYAADFIFEYDDLPKGAMAIRDTFLPFFSWTYKAIPAMFTTVTNYPWRFAAPAVAMYAVNAAMYAFAFGEKDDDWWQKIGRYVTDSDFRDKVRAQEKSERANLPPWLKGNSFTLGLPKAIRLGMDELTQLPVFMDISRMFPAGDLLDANSNAGGVPWLQSLTPSNPVFTTLSAIFVNRDLWTGRDVVDKNDTSAEAATKRAEWVWKQFTPAIAFGNYQLDRMLDTVARAAGTEIPGMFRDHTGVGKDKLPVQPLYTIENTFGIKARPYDLEQSRQIEEGQKKSLIRSLEYEIKRTQRYVNSGVMSFREASKQIETDRAKIQNLKQGLTLEGAEKD